MHRNLAGLKALIFVAVCVQTSRAAVVDLRGSSTLPQKSTIELRDVAQIADRDEKLVERLGGITLAPAPSAGRSTRLTFDEIRARLQALGVNLADVEFRGQQATEVRMATAVPAVQTSSAAPSGLTPRRLPATHKVPPARWEESKANEILLTAFRRAFRTEALESQRMRIRCEVQSQDVRRVLPIAAEDIRFRESQIDPGAPQFVTAWWVDTAGETREVRLQVTIDESPLALAVKQNLPIGAVLRPDDLIWVAAEENSPGMTRLADVIGKQARRNLRAGKTLQPEDITAVELIRNNDIVTVSVRRGGITVRRPFKAQSSGGLGDPVNLSAVDDPRVRIQATITGYHEASLSPDAAEPAVENLDRGSLIEIVSPQPAVR